MFEYTASNVSVSFDVPFRAPIFELPRLMSDLSSSLYVQLADLLTLGPENVRIVNGSILADNALVISMFRGNAHMRVQPDNFSVGFTNANPDDYAIIEKAATAIAMAVAAHISTSRWRPGRLRLNGQLEFKADAKIAGQLLESFGASAHRILLTEPSMLAFYGHRANIVVDDWICDFDLGPRWHQPECLWLSAGVSPYGEPDQDDSPAARIQGQLDIFRKGMKAFLASVDLYPASRERQ